MTCATLLETGIDPFAGVMGVSRGSGRGDAVVDAAFYGEVFASIHDVPRTREATIFINKVLEKMSDDALLRLDAGGWTGCEESDTVGLLHGDIYGGDAQEITDGSYIGDDENRLDGYEVVIDKPQGRGWILAHRPHLASLLLNNTNG